MINFFMKIEIHSFFIKKIEIGPTKDVKSTGEAPSPQRRKSRVRRRGV
jgi:hypothetical protein